jgi:formate dehydrogenase subunit gamma
VHFWSQFVLVGTLLVTGIGLWEAGLGWFEYQLGFTATIEQMRSVAVIHAAAATLAIVIWIVHVYAAIWVRGTLSAMTRGSVTGGWGWRHHRKWLKKEVAAATSSGPRRRRRSKRTRHPCRSPARQRRDVLRPGPREEMRLSRRGPG